MLYGLVLGNYTNVNNMMYKIMYTKALNAG